jgi:hypothetical protein
MSTKIREQNVAHRLMGYRPSSYTIHFNFIPPSTRASLTELPLLFKFSDQNVWMHILSLHGLENREYSRRDPSRWPRGTRYPQHLALTWPTSGSCSICIVRSRTRTTEFLFNNVCALQLAQAVCLRFRTKWRGLVRSFCSKAERPVWCRDFLV